MSCNASVGESSRYGSILIDCVTLRDTIDTEIKQWISVYGRAMQTKYKREMDFIVAQVMPVLFEISEMVAEICQLNSR